MCECLKSMQSKPRAKALIFCPGATRPPSGQVFRCNNPLCAWRLPSVRPCSLPADVLSGTAVAGEGHHTGVLEELAGGAATWWNSRTSVILATTFLLLVPLVSLPQIGEKGSLLPCGASKMCATSNELVTFAFLPDAPYELDFNRSRTTCIPHNAVLVPHPSWMSAC